MVAMSIYVAGKSSSKVHKFLSQEAWAVAWLPDY
jgi:hypothetical protein